MILRLLWPAARSSRLTIFLIFVCMSRTSLNCTSDCKRARVISLRHSLRTFSSIMVALLICWRARDMLVPNCANTIFAASENSGEVWSEQDGEVRARVLVLGDRRRRGRRIGREVGNEFYVQVVVAIYTLTRYNSVFYNATNRAMYGNLPIGKVN